MPLQRLFNEEISKYFSRNDRVLAAVSGGADSICLAELLSRSDLVRFSIVHCNFHLRGQESDGDESFVRDWAEKHGVEVFVEHFSTMDYSKEHGISIEMAARELRYKRFAELCLNHKFSAIITAHNANDNAETLILNILRGTGIDGLTGMGSFSIMPYSDGNVKLARPMLRFSRDEIEHYLQLHNVSFRTDSSNGDSYFRRNRIRNLIFPEFKEINPSFIGTLNSEMKRLAQIKNVANEYYSTHRDSIIRFEASSRRHVIDTDKLTAIPQWEYMLYRVMDEFGFSGDNSERITLMLNNGCLSPGRTFQSDGYTCISERGQLVIKETKAIDGKSIFITTISGDGLYRLGEQEVSISISELIPQSLAIDNGIICDADFLGLPFTLRQWREGDYIAPLGMKGRKKKLSDLFKDDHVGNSLRTDIIVAVREEQSSHVLAIPALGRIDESIRISPKSKKTITIRKV